jgi:hypothetical protein
MEAIFAEEIINPEYEEIEYYGVKLLVERIAPTQCRIVRLLSTDPVDFLRSELQPGNLISYLPV